MDTFDFYTPQFLRVIQHEERRRDCITIDRVHIKMAGGWSAAAMLSQIVYWFGIGRDGQPRASIVRGGRLWIAKKHSDWQDEIGLDEREARYAIEALKKKGLIHTEVFHYNSVPMVHISIEQDAYMAAEDAATQLPISPTDAERQVHLPPSGNSNCRTASNAPLYTKTTSKTTFSLPRSASTPVLEERREKYGALLTRLEAKIKEHCRREGRNAPPNREGDSLREIDKTITQSGIPADDLERLLEWALRDRFWQNLVLSIPHWGHISERNGLPKIRNCYIRWQEETAPRANGKPRLPGGPGYVSDLRGIPEGEVQL